MIGVTENVHNHPIAQSTSDDGDDKLLQRDERKTQCENKTEEHTDTQPGSVQVHLFIQRAAELIVMQIQYDSHSVLHVNLLTAHYSETSSVRFHFPLSFSHSPVFSQFLG